VAEHGAAAVRTEGLTLRDRDGAVYADVGLTVRPGTLVAVTTEDRLARRALLATLAGRLGGTTGRAVVLDRVLPDEAAAVRRRALLLDGFPTRPHLTALERDAARGQAPLVLVDDVDRLAGPDEVAARWAALERLAELGATVVAGTATDPGTATVVRIDDSTVPTLEATP
jgi:predicted ABC-type transport system involved in lysophospholipase L1 biosynthesis ATPase subunit